mmetsp:Transcript_59412/g.128472  ORF Transcript_59412/g.128472 Transcript_59412/m.128472 type:complete len:661 (+) Transcript_59412:1-1983(+)
MEDLKPQHLAVPERLLEGVRRMDKPSLYLESWKKEPKYLVGAMEPKPSIDPAEVRALVHRLDDDHDNLIQERELSAYCHKYGITLTHQDIVTMVNEIVSLRPRPERSRRSVDWAEIYSAVKPNKRWVPAMDVHIQRESDSYFLIVEVEAFDLRCQEVYRALLPRCQSLESPAPDSSAAGSAEASVCPWQSRGVQRTQRLNKFLASLLEAVDSQGEQLQRDDEVQRLLVPQEEKEAVGLPREIRSAACMSQRRLWAHHLRPNSKAWGRILRTMGVQPGVRSANASQKRQLEGHLEHEASQQRSRNVARPEASQRGGAVEQLAMRTREPKRVQGRQRTSSSPAAPWEEKRTATETSVNRCLAPLVMQGESREVAYTFEARQKFQQALAMQERASKERRCLSLVGTEAVATFGASDATTSLGGKKGGKARGSSAFSLSAPGGVRGHFHNSAVVHSRDGSHVWPQSLQVNWDGEHIDHSKSAPLKDDVKLSTMTREERSRQFSSITGRSHDCFGAKARRAADQINDVGQFTNWQQHEFRSDCPLRNGKFGRRAFDPQVREQLLGNPHGISEIEGKPLEDRLEGLLDRTAPSNARPFKPYMPSCERPQRHEEMSSRSPVHDVLGGEQKRTQMGYGQIRHSNLATDMRLYTRPLGVNHMDRRLPIA